MKRSLRALEQLQSTLSTSNVADGNHHHLLEERRIKEAAKQQQLAKLSPYKRAEYACLECVAELRDALRDVEELQYTLHGGSSTSTRRFVPRLSREEENDGAGDDGNGEDDERTQLLGSRGRQQDAADAAAGRFALTPARRRTGEAALLEQELVRAKQRARRAHQRLQQLQRDAARLITAAPPDTSATAADAAAGAPSAVTSSAVLEAMEWQRAEKHVEQARRWYRELFGIHVVSSSLIDPTSSSSSALQLNRPAQLLQSPGSMSHFGSGANPLPPGVAPAHEDVPHTHGTHEQYNAAGEGKTRTLAMGRGGGGGADGGSDSVGWTNSSAPSALGGGEGESTAWSTSAAASPSPELMLRSAREDAEFQEFFASVQANDDLMDAALDRLSEGLARLLDNARGMQDELAVQEELLRVTETRIDENEAQIQHMNRRLRRAIRDMNDSSICMYVVCLIVLLLLLGVLLRIIR